jgi:cation:H+ antiporter
MIIALLQIIGGLVLLVTGGDALVKGAVALAKNLGISAIVIGLTVVAFGTSAPEMFISVQAAVDYPDIAIGNVIGSNIANILLVIGATTLITPIIVHQRIAHRDGVIMLGITLLFAALAMSGTMTFMNGVVLLGVVVAYTVLTIRYVHSHKTEPDLMEEIEAETDVHMVTWRALLYCVAGVGLLTFGSEVLIDGSVILAERAGLSEAVIGATIIAVGGSTPELVTSVMAAIRKHGDIGLANVVGSNIFNLSAVTGAAALVSPLTVSPKFLQGDLWVMLGVTGVFFVAMLARKQIGRAEGVAMLVAYAAYIGWQYNVIS